MPCHSSRHRRHGLGVNRDRLIRPGPPGAPTRPWPVPWPRDQPAPDRVRVDVVDLPANLPGRPEVAVVSSAALPEPKRVGRVGASHPRGPFFLSDGSLARLFRIAHSRARRRACRTLCPPDVRLGVQSKIANRKCVSPLPLRHSGTPLALPFWQAEDGEKTCGARETGGARFEPMLIIGGENRPQTHHRIGMRRG